MSLFRNKVWFAAAVFLVSALALSVSADNGPSKEALKFRALGDKAFKDGIYNLAAEFYERYQKESGNTPSADLDAGKRLVATYVRSGNAKKAKVVLDALFAKHASLISADTKTENELEYWRGCVSMAAGKLKSALATFSKLLKKLPQDSSIYFQTLDAAAAARALLGKWDEAEKTCALLEFAGRNTQWREEAAIRKIIAVIMMGSHQQARQLIAGLKGGGPAPKLLECLICLREGQYDKALDIYNRTRKDARTADPLWFTIAYSLAEVMDKEGRKKIALSIFDDAVLFADNENDRQRALVSIINTAVASGNTPLAVKTAEKFLKSYPDSFVSNGIRYRLAKLQAKQENPDNALKELQVIISDPTADIEIKIKAAKEAGHILLDLKRFKEASKMFAYMRKNAPDEKTRGEGAFGMATTLYADAKYKEAATMFAKTADEFPSWREMAVFKEMQSLMNAGDYSGALKASTRFLKEFPKSTLAGDVLFFKALAMKNSNNPLGAEKTFAVFADKYPKNKYAARALFEEGGLAMDKGAYDNAIKAFTKLIDRYPDHPLVPNVVYKRLFAFFWKNRDAEAIADIHFLSAKYPNSIYTTHAKFRLAEYYMNHKSPDRAVATLRGIADSRKEKDKVSAALAVYKIADIYFQTSRPEEALKALDELSENFPNSKLVADGTFLRGEIHADQDEYEKAIPFFKKAATERPDSMLETAAWGRVGDCYLALGWKAPDGSNYLEATNFYNKILDKKNVPESYIEQALYKIGRCEELIGDKGKAILKYRSVVYRRDLNNEIGGITATSSPWFAKAAIAAARLYNEKNTPEAGEAAIAIYNTLIKAGVNPADDFKRKIKDIRERFKLK